MYALLTNGSLYAWGTGTHGQLGDGGTTSSFTPPVQVMFPAGVTIASIPVNSEPRDTAGATALISSTSNVVAVAPSG